MLELYICASSRIMIILAMHGWAMSLWNMIQWYSSELIDLVSFVLYNSKNKYCYILRRRFSLWACSKIYLLLLRRKLVSKIVVWLLLVLGTIVDRIYVLTVTPTNWPGQESDLGFSSCLILVNIRCIHPLDVQPDSLSALLLFKARPVLQKRVCGTLNYYLGSCS